MNGFSELPEDERRKIMEALERDADLREVVEGWDDLAIPMQRVILDIVRYAC